VEKNVKTVMEIGIGILTDDSANMESVKNLRDSSSRLTTDWPWDCSVYLSEMMRSIELLLALVFDEHGEDRDNDVTVIVSKSFDAMAIRAAASFLVANARRQGFSGKNVDHAEKVIAMSNTIISGAKLISIEAEKEGVSTRWSELGSWKKKFLDFSNSPHEELRKFSKLLKGERK